MCKIIQLLFLPDINTVILSLLLILFACVCTRVSTVQTFTNIYKMFITQKTAMKKVCLYNIFPHSRTRNI